MYLQEPRGLSEKSKEKKRKRKEKPTELTLFGTFSTRVVKENAAKAIKLQLLGAFSLEYHSNEGS